MYRLSIPQPKPLETALQSVEQIYRYADMMMNHVISPVTLLDIPYPIYVLRNIANSEKTSFDGLQTIVALMQDVAYIACNAVTSAGNTGTVYRTSGCMFNSSETKDLHLMIAELNRRANSHKDILPRLQDLQEDSMDSYNHLTKRKLLLASQEKKLALMEKDHTSYEVASKKWLNYKMKVESASFAHNKNTTHFQELLYRERRLRLDMEELQQELRQLLREKIEIRLRKSLDNMATTIELVDLECSNIRFQIVKSRISTIDVRDIAESLIPKCSMEYEYPNIQEIIKATGFSEPLPTSHMVYLSRHQKDKTGDKELLMATPECNDIKANGDLDRNTNNGCYLKVVGTKPAQGPEFLKLKRDHTFKQKLTVMNGEVAFGWARKGRFGQKKWGFYDSQLVTRVV
ncbi:uncharacterized protein [Argopecten irradians]|uniref:uncharacterized protein n=1 Tax=Argopecten irradians TaxID=31199 RepID=UPI00371162C3